MQHERGLPVNMIYIRDQGRKDCSILLDMAEQKAFEKIRRNSYLLKRKLTIINAVVEAEKMSFAQTKVRESLEGRVSRCSTIVDISTLWKMGVTVLSKRRKRT